MHQTCMYRDWMDTKAGMAVAEEMLDRGVECEILDKCGHQLYIEQPDSFNDFVLRMIDPKKNAAFRKPVMKKY